MLCSLFMEMFKNMIMNENTLVLYDVESVSSKSIFKLYGNKIVPKYGRKQINFILGSEYRTLYNKYSMLHPLCLNRN